MPSFNKYAALFVCVIWTLIVSGCSLLEIREQSSVVESVGAIKGSISIDSPQKGKVIVLLFLVENETPALVAQVPSSENGTYQFNVGPGTHYIAAFIDINNDGQYQKNEHGNLWGSPSAVVVAEKATVTLDPIHISGVVPETGRKDKVRHKLLDIVKNIGHVTTMTDPKFTAENASMGMWRPLDFLEQVGGGLFFLQPYDPDKVPVLFVHGVNGNPTNWQSVIASMDNQKTQAWVLYYPSGLRLDLISDYMVNAVVSLQNEHKFDRLCVVAHSMGGLVTRSFVKKYIERAPQASESLDFVMTVNSPMDGMSSAAAGVKYSPILVPAWNDIAPDSDFIKELTDWVWPEDIPYHLVFSFTEGSSDDGVVALRSQIPLRLQSESVRIYGFENNHVGTLSDSNFLTLFNDVLNATLNESE